MGSSTKKGPWLPAKTAASNIPYLGLSEINAIIAAAAFL